MTANKRTPELSAIFAIALLLTSCARDDVDRADAAAADGRAADLRVRADHALRDLARDLRPPADLSGSCEYSRDYACFRCPGGTFGRDYKTACRAKDDCERFCGPLPPGWIPCEYRGFGESPDFCNGWPTPPRGTLRGCSKRSSPGPYGLPKYSCPFCIVKNASVTFAVDEQGTCYAFGSCQPRTFRSDPDCPPDTDGGLEHFHDAGVP